MSIDFFEGEINKKSVFLSLLSILFFFGLKVGFFLLILFYLNHKDSVRIDILVITNVLFILFLLILTIMRTHKSYKKEYDKLVFFITIKVILAFLSALAIYYLHHKDYKLMVIFGALPVLAGLIVIYYVIKKVVFTYKEKKKSK